MIRTMGPVSGYMAILVLALYINSEQVTELYSNPWLLWLICPILLYWLTRIWFFAHRGEVAHDPIIFALRDKISYVVGSMVAVTIILAS